MAFKKMKTGPYKGLFKFEFGRAGKNYEAEYFNSIEEGQAWLDSKREGSPRQINYEKFGKNYRKSELKKASQFLYEENKISSPDYDKIPSDEKQIVREKLRQNKGIFKKRNMFTPLAKGKQEIIKKYFPDADFSKGKSGFSPKDKSYSKVNEFIRRGFKPAYAPLFKYEQQQLVKAFPDIEFDFSRPGKFGIPGSHPNYRAVSNHLDEPKPYRYPNEVRLRQPRGWTFAQMDRAGDNVYEPILEKPNKPFASDNRIKGFIEKSTGKKYTYANINTHPKYKEIEKIFGIAERSRTPLSNYPTMVKYLPKGFDPKKVWLNDVLQVIADKKGIEGVNRAKRAIEIHHAEGVKKNIGNVQPLRRDLNVLAETISKSKNIDTQTGELIKNNIRLELGGKNYGIKPQNPEKYFSNLIKGASTAMQEPNFEKNFVKAITDSPYACKVILNKLVGGGTASCEAEVRRDPLGVAKKLENVKPTSAALGKVRNAARSFLNFAGKGKTFAVTAGVGAGAGALVKAFRNDDPETYLTNDKQANAMILDTADQLEREERQAAVGDAPELLDESAIGAELGLAAAAVPGSKKLFDARKKKGFGAVRAGLGPVGKALSGFATPLGIAATTPLNVASQVYAGDSVEDIATDPLNYLGPAFAGTLTKEATRGMNPTGMLSKALRLGMNPATIRAGSKFLGLPGLALSLGYEGYDQYKKYTEGRGFVYNLLNKDE
jgi:hypothetical protein